MMIYDDIVYAHRFQDNAVAIPRYSTVVSNRI